MLMPKHYLLLALLVASASPGHAQEGRTRALEATLASTVGEYSVSAADPLNALLKVASDFQLPMGIEWIKDATGPVNRSWKQTTVSNVLSDIAAFGGRYLIDTSDGVVHIAPAAWKGTGSDILDLRLDSFEVSDQYVRFAVDDDLHTRVRLLMEPETASLGYIGSIITGYGDRRVTVKLMNPTVRDVLDALCLAADLKVWLVGYTSSPTKSSAGYSRTASLWEDSNSEVDAFSQPFIAIQAWGTPVLRRAIPALPHPTDLPIMNAPDSQEPGHAP